jgi:hypothetical protein
MTAHTSLFASHVRRSLRTCSAVAAGLSLALALPLLPARAQSIRGTVLDDIGGAPLGEVELWLVAGDKTLSIVVRTDADGRFLLAAPVAGQYAVHTRRLGYVPLASAPIELAGDAELVVEVRLTRAAQLLDDTVRVTAAGTRHPHMDGFEDRRRLGLGTFFTRADIEARGQPRLLDLLRTISWITIPSAASERLGNVRNGLVRRCATVVFLDGVRLNRADDSPEYIRSLLESVNGNSLEGVELYRGRSDLPAEFGGPEVRCGVIAIWTRRPNYQRDSTATSARKPGNGG